jgi:hypothetical protein
MSQPTNNGTLLDTATSGPLRWPSDAIMVVAARAGTENRAQMEGIIDATCRRCSADLAGDTRTMREARKLSDRYRKPVMFFCVECCLLHARENIDLLVDQRGGRNDVIQKGANNASRLDL